MARVDIVHLDKVFQESGPAPIHALRDVHLVVEEGELMALVGPSGCGKTTLLRTMAGLEEASGGTISIAGKVVNQIPAKDRKVAMVFQNYALYPHMTVFENMAFGLKLRKFPKAEIESRVAAAAEILGLTPCLTRLPNVLSGGERQRAALGRAIVHEPEVFLLDEPLSNLDAAMRARMRIELAKLQTRLGATMIYVTHDQVEAMALGHRIAVMKEGVIQQVAPPMELYHRPANLFVAGFIGSPPMNFFRGRLRAKGLEIDFEATTPKTGRDSDVLSVRWPTGLGARLERLAGREVVLGIRPEDIAVMPLGAQGAASFSLATIEVIERRGADTYLHVTKCPHDFIARVQPDFPARVREPIAFGFNLEKAHFFDPDSETVLARCGPAE